MQGGEIRSWCGARRFPYQRVGIACGRGWAPLEHREWQPGAWAAASPHKPLAGPADAPPLWPHWRSSEASGGWEETGAGPHPAGFLEEVTARGGRAKQGQEDGGRLGPRPRLSPLWPLSGFQAPTASVSLPSPVGGRSRLQAPRRTPPPRVTQGCGSLPGCTRRCGARLEDLAWELVLRACCPSVDEGRVG